MEVEYQSFVSLLSFSSWWVSIVCVLKGTVFKMQRTEWFLGSSLIIFANVDRVVYADIRYHPYSEH